MVAFDSRPCCGFTKLELSSGLSSTKASYSIGARGSTGPASRQVGGQSMASRRGTMYHAKQAGQARRGRRKAHPPRSNGGHAGGLGRKEAGASLRTAHGRVPWAHVHGAGGGEPHRGPLGVWDGACGATAQLLLSSAAGGPGTTGSSPAAGLRAGEGTDGARAAEPGLAASGLAGQHRRRACGNGP